MTSVFIFLSWLVGWLQPREAKTLYDFEAHDDNELSFHAGALVTVTDDSDSNWWCGRLANGEQGLVIHF